MNITNIENQENFLSKLDHWNNSKQKTVYQQDRCNGTTLAELEQIIDRYI